MKRKDQPLTLKNIEDLLTRQSSDILETVDFKLPKSELRVIDSVDKKLQKMEIRINQKIERLTTTLDRFLKRLVDIEDEFEIMKADINRIKKVVQDKLGVEIA